MRFISLYKTDPEGACHPPTPELMARMAKLIESETKAGILLATEGFGPSAKDVRVRADGGKFIVTDGPFTEAKEIVGGFAVLSCKSRDEAVEAAKRFLDVVGTGECEIHELPEFSPVEMTRR
jgi:hypothetical protein